MLRVEIGDDSLQFGEHLRVSFHRTLRVPLTAHDFPLPPTFGRFPLERVGVARGASPLEAAIPIRNREALWVAFDGSAARPNAVRVGVGNVNAIDGRPWDRGLRDRPQNYIVTGQQFWLDGVNAGNGFVRQFVATPFGEGTTVEEQAGGGAHGGVRVEVFDPKPGRFPKEASPATESAPAGRPVGAPPLGLGAGGRISQKIHVDPHGIDVWDTTHSASVVVRLLDPATFASLTGREVPPSPIDATTYARLGLPWFELYEKDAQDVSAADAFRDLRAPASDDDEIVDATALRVRPLRRPDV